MIKYRISKTEAIALALTCIFLGLGIYLGISEEATWLNRFGSLIIITGVFLAATRFSENLENRINDFIRKNGKIVIQAIIKNNEHFLGVKLEESHRSKLIEVAEAKLKEEFSNYQSNRNRAFKLYEIMIVAFGTFVNGFGDKIISYVLCAM
jgi:hypothetical protein